MCVGGCRSGACGQVLSGQKTERDPHPHPHPQDTQKIWIRFLFNSSYPPYSAQRAQYSKFQTCICILHININQLTSNIQRDNSFPEFYSLLLRLNDIFQTRPPLYSRRRSSRAVIRKKLSFSIAHVLICTKNSEESTCDSVLELKQRLWWIKWQSIQPVIGRYQDRTLIQSR